MEKKLYRNEHDKMLAGVCSGLADYMQMELTVVRLLFVLLTVFVAGAGVVIYIVLWVITPVNPDPNARMEKFKQYFDKQDPNMFNTANAFNNAGNTDTNKWNTQSTSFGSGPVYDPEAFKNKDNTSRVIGGLALLIFGLYFLIRQLDILPYWFSIGKLWPLILIIVGVSFILKSKRDKSWEDFKAQQKTTEKEPIVTPPPAAPEETNESTTQNS